MSSAVPPRRELLIFRNIHLSAATLHSRFAEATILLPDFL